MPKKRKNYALSLIESVAFGEQDAEDAVDAAMADMTGDEGEAAAEPAESAGQLPPNLSQVIDALAEVRATVDKAPDMKNADSIRKSVDELVSGVHSLAGMMSENRKMHRKIGVALLSEIIGKPVPPEPVPLSSDAFGPKEPGIDDSFFTPNADQGYNMASGAKVEGKKWWEQDEEPAAEMEPGEDEEEEEEEEGEEEEGGAEEESVRRSIELLKGDSVLVHGHGKCKVVTADAQHVLIETTSGHRTVIARKQAKYLGELVGKPASDVSAEKPQNIPDLRYTDPEQGQVEKQVTDYGSETEVGFTGFPK